MVAMSSWRWNALPWAGQANAHGRRVLLSPGHAPPLLLNFVGGETLALREGHRLRDSARTGRMCARGVELMVGKGKGAEKWVVQDTKLRCRSMQVAFVGGYEASDVDGRRMDAPSLPTLPR